MEKWAMRELKKAEEAEKNRKKNDEEEEHKMSQKEIDDLNRQFGCPAPPTHVCAIG